MLKKPQGRVIVFPKVDSATSGKDPQGPGPQPAQAKPKFHGNAPTNHSVLTMHKIWVHKVARFYRMDPQRVEETIIEAIQTRRAA